MRHISKWFSTDFVARDDDYWDGETPWYQHQIYNHWGDRLRVEIGDIVAEAETEGGDAIGPSFGIDLHLWQNCGQFDRDWPKDEKAHYEDHGFTVIFWRWGIYIAARGRRIPKGES